jgi:Lrp/AsnC family leucine-responsive transcriptional regulator
VEEIDRKIVSLLTRNGRMSFTELARQAGLSVSAVHQRVRRLEQDGVIKGYVAVFDPDDVGLPLTAFISIKPFDAAAPDDLPQRLEHLAAIEACHSVAGDENYILKVRVTSPVATQRRSPVCSRQGVAREITSHIINTSTVFLISLS